MKKLLLTLLPLILLVITSCSESKNPTDPGTGNEVLMLNSVGSYWINNSVLTEQPSGAEIDSTRTIDSVVVTNNGTYAGRQASSVVTFVNGVALDTIYINQNSNELYSYRANFGFGSFQLNNWTKEIDYTASSWKPFNDTAFSNTTIEVDNNTGITTILNGDLKANSVRGTTSTVKIDGKDYTATEVTTTTKYNFTIKFTIQGNTVQEFPFIFDSITKSKFVKGIGMVRMETYAVGNGTPNAFVPPFGSLSSLLRFKKAQ